MLELAVLLYNFYCKNIDLNQICNVYINDWANDPIDKQI